MSWAECEPMQPSLSFVSQFWLPCSLVVLFMVFFSVGWTPLQALYPSEVLSYQNRAKGLALQGWGASASGLINTFGLPVALEQIDYIGEYEHVSSDV